MGDSNKPGKAPRYTTDLLSIPGFAFHINVPDAKDRIQAYIDDYRNAEAPNQQV